MKEILNKDINRKIIYVDFFYKFSVGIKLADIVSNLFFNKSIVRLKINSKKLIDYYDKIKSMDYNKVELNVNSLLNCKEAINYREIVFNKVYRSSEEYNSDINFKTIIDLRGKEHSNSDKINKEIKSKQIKNALSYIIFFLFGMRKLYKFIFKNCKKYIIETLHIFENEQNFPILFHCVHGKDSTGIISALLYIIKDKSHVNINNICIDYAQSEKNLKNINIDEKNPIYLPKDLYETKHYVIGNVILTELLLPYLKCVEKSSNNSNNNSNYNYDLIKEIDEFDNDIEQKWNSLNKKKLDYLNSLTNNNSKKELEKIIENYHLDNQKIFNKFLENNSEKVNSNLYESLKHYFKDKKINLDKIYDNLK